jgi:hypothetical protein
LGGGWSVEMPRSKSNFAVDRPMFDEPSAYRVATPELFEHDADMAEWSQYNGSDHGAPRSYPPEEYSTSRRRVRSAPGSFHRKSSRERRPRTPLKVSMEEARRGSPLPAHLGMAPQVLEVATSPFEAPPVSTARQIAESIGLQKSQIKLY